MSFKRNYHQQVGTSGDDCYYSFNKRNFSDSNRKRCSNWSNSLPLNFNHVHNNLRHIREQSNFYHYEQPNNVPPLKRRKFSSAAGEDCARHCPPPPLHYTTVTSKCSNLIPCPMRVDGETCTSNSLKRDCSKLENDEPVFISRDEIERSSPSRKDGIDAQHETYLRYSYCAFIQNLGLRLQLPQTTIGTAMVLCHRFFFRRSHACHDRFLIATAALFLAAKSEETPRALNNVVKVSCEILHKQDISFLSYVLPVDWFEQYRERVVETEQMILTTLNFELDVQHPYAPLTFTLNKLGLSQTMLVNLALNLISEGLRSSLWLQFKPQHIAAGAAYLAAKFLNFDLACHRSIWQEFQTTPAILEDVTQQLMELF